MTPDRATRRLFVAGPKSSTYQRTAPHPSVNTSTVLSTLDLSGYRLNFAIEAREVD
jgi:hypothetical protein